jgi:hypothetical protein
MPLTPYESEQVRRIAGWKAEPPSYLARLRDSLSYPLVNLAERALRHEKVYELLNDAYRSSEVSTHREKVISRAGVGDLAELRCVEMATCDALADEFAKTFERRAMAVGAGVGGGNLLAAMMVVTSLLHYCLKVVHTVGYCYGFGTEEPHERDYVLGILLIASANSPREKQEAIVTLGHVEDAILAKAFEELAEDAIFGKLVESGEMSSIPSIGILLGAVEFTRMTEHVARVAKFTFQERWLRENGKLVDSIAPDSSAALAFAKRVGLKVAASAYWTTFGASFVVALPAVWLFQWVPANHALGRGLGAGRDDAVRDARRRRLTAPTGQPAPILPASAAALPVPAPT